MYDGDAPARRAAGRRADPRPRPAARAARPGGAARAARPRGARRPRAEPPGADRRPPGDDGRPAPRPAAPARRPVGRRDRRPRPRAAQPPATRWLTELVAVAARRARPGSPATTAGSRSRTSPATATASASRRRPACPARSSARPSAPSTGCSPGSPRTHGPFLTPEPARRWGLPLGVVEDALERLLDAGTLLRGEFRPGGAEREWIDPDVLRLLRRRSLARLRREVEPVDPAALARFLPAWQGVAAVGEHRRRRSAASAALERLAEVVDQLAGLADPGLGPGARRPAGPRSPATSRASSTSSGALGEVAWVGRGQPRPRRRPDRPVPAGPRGRSGRSAAPTRRRSRRPARATRRSASTSRRAARRSIASCSRRPAAAPTARCSTRCGTSSGPARSRTTRSRRSGRCAGSGPAARTPRRRGRAG